MKAIKRKEPNHPNDPTLANIFQTTAKVHELKLKLEKDKQNVKDMAIHDDTENVTISMEKDHLQSAWGIWRHYKSSIATDGSHRLPAHMRTNQFEKTDPCRWKAGSLSTTQKEGARVWHQFRYALFPHCVSLLQRISID